ncbi:MAG: RagB/SusD family nutrient uptake outer membrane protein [Saprospiraceae bacterium]|nr:RagB/SusD family nutrient uptake outer membrane protein [Lewinella sp.]
MKKILSITILFALLLVSQSCRDFLVPDIESEIELDGFGSTPEEVNFILTQAYSELRNDDITGNIYWRRFSTDYAVPPAGTSLAQSNIARMSYDANDGEVFDIWQAHYQAISRPNLVIEKAVNAQLDPEPGTESEWKRMEGEARFIRAFLYFNLVRLYRNAPLIDKFIKTFDDIDAVANLSGDRMDEQESLLYDFIINDLNIAVDLLADNVDQGRAGKAAAQTLLGHVYLTRATNQKYRDARGDGAADFQNAVNQLGAVIAGGKYGLKQYFPDNFIRDKQHTGTEEAIFTLEFSELDNAGMRVGDANGFLNNSGSSVELGTSNGANGGKLANDFGFSVFDLNSPGDIVRRFWTFEEGEFVSIDASGNGKYENGANVCPDGSGCEIFLRTREPFPWTRPYWFEIVDDPNAFRHDPSAADITVDENGNPAFAIIWADNNPNNLPGVRLVKYRRNPITQSNFTTSTYDADLAIYRYAAVLLMYAEATNELVGSEAVPTGGSLTALEAVNQVRDRARNFVYYPDLSVDRRIIDEGPYAATYGDVYSRVPQLGTNPPNTVNADSIISKYYFEISAFRGLREVPPTPEIRNFKEFPESKNFVPDFPSDMSQVEFREELLDERWRELAGELNMRWFDLTRYGRLTDRIQEYQQLINPMTNRNLLTTPFGEQVLQIPDKKFEYLPIPKSEIDRNANLKQNAGF